MKGIGYAIAVLMFCLLRWHIFEAQVQIMQTLIISHQSPVDRTQSIAEATYSSEVLGEMSSPEDSRQSGSNRVLSYPPSSDIAGVDIYFLRLLDGICPLGHVQ